MVNHWFGGKDGLFVAAMDLPINPEHAALSGSSTATCRPRERIGAHFLTVWEPRPGGAFVATPAQQSPPDSAPPIGESHTVRKCARSAHRGLQVAVEDPLEQLLGVDRQVHRGHEEAVLAAEPGGSPSPRHAGRGGDRADPGALVTTLANSDAGRREQRVLGVLAGGSAATRPPRGRGRTSGRLLRGGWLTPSS